jgi:hypothetical protein
MKLRGAGQEDRKKMMAVAGFVVIAGGLLYYELYGGTSAPAPPAAPVVVTVPAPGAGGTASGETAASEGSAGGPAAKVVGTTSGTLDPTLHMDAMLVSESVEYAGYGRNIFSTNSAPPPVVIPKPVASARQLAAQVQAPVVQTCPPNCPPPPPPPPIDLKFFGIETMADGQRKAFLLHDDVVVVASAGDVVLRRYRVVTIEAKTIQVEDMQNKNTQTLPLLTE